MIRVPQERPVSHNSFSQIPVLTAILFTDKKAMQKYLWKKE